MERGRRLGFVPGAAIPLLEVVFLPHYTHEMLYGVERSTAPPLRRSSRHSLTTFSEGVA